MMRLRTAMRVLVIARAGATPMIHDMLSDQFIEATIMFQLDSFVYTS